MKLTTIVGVSAFALSLVACSHRSSTITTTPVGYITKDSANKMIGSYLASLPPDTANDTSLHALIVDADLLRDYLANESIKKVKIMFAHTLRYINTGHAGQNAGYKNNALTIVIAGYDNDGDYVFYSGNMVPDHATPCPRNCPESGTAAGSLLE